MDQTTELTRLKALAAYTPAGPEDPLTPLLAAVADYLGAGRVSLMMIDCQGERPPCLSLVAAHGRLDRAAWREQPRLGQGIAGQVLAEGRPLRVEDIHASRHCGAARHPDEAGSFLACPVALAGAPAGVLNVSAPIRPGPFSDLDLARADLAATLVGRILQTLRLQGLIDSRFAQMALAREGISDATSFLAAGAQEPGKVARMLAKSFYKEMHRCGFSFNQILHAAGEIISELDGSLSRHKRRGPRPPPAKGTD